MAGQRVIISVLADTKKFSRAFKNLSREVGLSRLGDAFRNTGRRVVDFFRSGIDWAGRFALAVAGLAIAGGLSRMMNIEDAEAKLRGLGHTTETISAVMDDALESVKGTAFGLDSAATAAASAMAAGIKPGQELQAYLSRLADSATIAGTSMDDMSSIYGKIATANRAQTTEINQIADRGIPIWAKLAEQYGVTQEELRKMVSAGQVDAQSFYTAMDELVGGAALEAGNTTRGAFANMKAAASRAGAAFLQNIFPMFKDALGGITEWFDTAAERVAPIGQAIATWITKRAVPAIQEFAGWVRKELLPVLKQLWQTIKGAFTTAIETVAGALGDAGASAEGMGAGIKNGIITALQIAGPIIARIVTSVASFVAFLIRAKDIIIPLVGAIAGLVVAFQTISKIMAIVRAAQLALNIAMAANPIMLIVMLIAALVAGLIALWTTNEEFREAVTKIWNAVVDFFKGAIKKIQTWFSQLAAIPGRLWTWFNDARARAISAMVALVVWVGGLPGRIIGALASLAGRLASTALNAFMRFKTSAERKGREIVAWVRGIPDRIRQALGNLGRLLLDAGRQVIDGLLSGITGAFGRVRDKLGELTNLLPSWKGPAERDKKLLVGPGQMIMDGFIRGLEGRYGAVRDSLRDLTDLVAGTTMPDIAAPGIGTVSTSDLRSGAGHAAPGPVYNITVQALTATPEVGRHVVDAIRQFERVNGARR